MLCLDNEEAIALAFSRTLRLFVFFCCVLLFSNILHTRSVTHIKTWEPPMQAQSGASQQPHRSSRPLSTLLKGILTGAVEGAGKRVSFALRVQILLAPLVTSLLFEFLPLAICSSGSFFTAFPHFFPLFPTLTTSKQVCLACHHSKMLHENLEFGYY